MSQIITTLLAISFVILEVTIAYKKKVKVFDRSEIFGNLNCGALYSFAQPIIHSLMIAPYILLFNSLSLHAFNKLNFGHWVVALTLYDFIYYCYHYSTHKSPILWLFHVVHHQPKKLNTIAAFRMPLMSLLLKPLYFLPLAVIGVPIEMLLVCSIILKVYQIPLHSTVLGDWPQLIGLIFSSPSHHRVHHGLQDLYIDKNFGGILIIWDRIFGTFQKETIPAEFGTHHDTSNNNPLTINLKPFQEYFEKFKQLNLG